ncbi:proteasome activator [Wenjunlia tyrosinilytica]|jgi:hypothetical protein|uniref:Bacterial proteasome activator n=1 Tax=Wenjunlia tyrosinilytica TaxID=1544741 RepID=A0A917ZU14_9ACTN|nr:proteasome activator [Wenjunlia tyrosinilytica]GGO95288.1 hypothetical protein GCM10012280_52130 [Wenjunlia tyrosinilytica]
MTDQVAEPDRVVRIEEMVKELLGEARARPLDEAGRMWLTASLRRAVGELEQALAPELIEELGRLAEPFADPEAPSHSELLLAQAQLVGWLEGLWAGIRTSLTLSKTEVTQPARGLSMPDGGSYL